MAASHQVTDIRRDPGQDMQHDRHAVRAGAAGCTPRGAGRGGGAGTVTYGSVSRRGACSSW